MPSVFAELAKRHRVALTECVARELRSSLGVGRSRKEAEGLADELAALKGDALAAWSAIQARARSWKRRGVSMTAIGRVLGAITSLAGAPASAAPRAGADREFDQVMRPLLDAVPTPVLLVDGRGRVRLVNQAVLKCCPGTPESFEGRSLAELFTFESGRTGETAAEGPPRLEHLRFTARPEMELTGARCDFNHPIVPDGWFLVISSHSVQASDQASLNARLQNEITQKEKFAALLTVSHAVVNSLDLNTILATIAQQVRQVIQTDECTVFLYDERSQLLVPVVCDVEQYHDEDDVGAPQARRGHHRPVALTGRGEIVNGRRLRPARGAGAGHAGRATTPR